MSKYQPDEDLGVQDKTGVSDPALNNLHGSGDAGVGPAPILEAEANPAQLLVELEQGRAEFAELKEKFLRAMAEGENIRRRAENDVSNARKFAVEGFAAEVLLVRDSLELARATEISDEDAGIVDKMKEGLDLTLKQLDTVFEKFGIRSVEPGPGDKFDPEQHQAVTLQESDSIALNHIITVIQKGYSIHDRLLRPAMVIVAKAGSQQGTESSAANT
jgi:molecular chaperone GrpE